MTHPSPLDPSSFDRLALANWYCENGRHALPWRRTRDPYAVLVSEVMLQQTQVERVRPYYLAWLERWPTVAALAAASPSDAIRAWSGLGYNRRALNLHRAAVAIVDRHYSVVPLSREALRALPGVGAYTAAAVASFAASNRVAVVDTNIGRVVARSVLGAENAAATTVSALNAAAEALLPQDGEEARRHNLALMDLGALVCRSRAPICEACPFAKACAWRAAGSPSRQANSTRAPAFQTTARFARGRIIAALSAQPSATEAALAEALPHGHRKSLPAYLAALESEGLIERHGAHWRLPSE